MATKDIKNIITGNRSFTLFEKLKTRFFYSKKVNFDNSA